MTLKELRIAKNLTQKELSTLTGVPQQYISKVENGRIRMSRSFGSKLIQHFDLTLEQVWLMMEQVPKRDPSARRGPYIGAGTKK